MTPEERAAKAVHELDVENYVPLETRIAQAIREAVEAERKACAAVARYNSGTCPDCNADIAAEIRARKEKP